MVDQLLDLETRRLKKALHVLYNLQKRNFSVDNIMPYAMKELKLNEDDAVRLIKALIDRGWLTSKGFLPHFFFRPGNIYAFPVIISAAGLAVLKETEN